MNSILSEKEYQKFILERLEQDNGYIIRDSKKYDRYYAVDRELVFKFLNNTQPDKMQILEKIYKVIGRNSYKLCQSGNHKDKG